MESSEASSDYTHEVIESIRAATMRRQFVTFPGLKRPSRSYSYRQMPVSVEQIRELIVAALPRLRRFARTITRHQADADDLVQIAIERALLRFEQWRPESKFESWMFGILRNAWIDAVRSRQRRDRVFLPEESGEHVGDSSSDAQVDRLSMQRALLALPEEQRMAVALVLIEGLSYKEAADVLDVPIGTVTSRLARGREALQKSLY
jgi:RNA polymerase sigma-70 factor (ECF subfamily)